MPEPLLHVFEVKTHGDQYAGTAVTQFVEANVGKAVMLEQLIKFLGNKVGRVGPSIFPLENVFTFNIFTAKCPAIFLLLLPDFKQQLFYFRQERELRRLEAFFGLSFSTALVTLETVCLMVRVFVSKSMLSHFRPITSLRRRP